MDYRSLIYSRYEVLWEDQKTHFDPDEALRWGRSYRFLLKSLLPADRAATILDLGCGTGKLLHNLKYMGYHRLHGIDASPEQARIAMQACENVVHGDVFDFLAGRREEFDAIIAFDFFEHFTKNEFIRLLELCYQALRPSGKLIVQTVNARSPMGLSCRYADLTHELCVTPDCLRNLLILVGFTYFAARERGPMPHNIVNSVRYVLWQFVRTVLWTYDLIEVGGVRRPIYTRDFVAVAGKPAAENEPPLCR